MGRQRTDPEERKALKHSLRAALRTAREARGLTQEQVAERVEVSVEFYARVERGTALPALDNLVRIADTLDISVDSMLPEWRPRLMEPDDPPVFRGIVEQCNGNPHLMRAVTAILAAFEQAEKEQAQNGKHARLATLAKEKSGKSDGEER